MKKLIALVLVLMMVLALAACGKDDDKKDSDKKDDKKNEATKTPTKGEDKPGETTPAAGAIDIIDGIKPVAELMNIDLAKAMPGAFAVDGTIMPPKYSLIFLFKDKIEEAERGKILDDFNTYLKSVATDGKIYLDQEFTAEWNAEEGRFEEQYGENLYIKLGKYGWMLQPAYGETNVVYTDGNQYPHFQVRIERFNLE